RVCPFCLWVRQVRQIERILAMARPIWPSLAAGLGHFTISTGQGGCQTDRLNGLTVLSLTIIPRQGDRQGRSKVDGRPRNRILAGRSARVFGCSVEALRSRPEDQSGNAPQGRKV